MWDAQKATSLKPDWPKAHYRLGSAHLALSQWGPAAAAFQQVLDLEPGNKEAKDRLSEAKSRLDQDNRMFKAVRSTELRSIVLKLRAARRGDQRLAMLNQIKQSMAGPDWDLEDLDWRPTFLPAMKHTPLDVQAIKEDPRQRLLLSYVEALADLSHPKYALPTLSDTARLDAYQSGINTILFSNTFRKSVAPHVLTLSSGGGVLGLMAGRAGAGRVTCIERSRMLYRMAKKVLDENKEAPGAVNIQLLSHDLRAVSVQGEPLPPEVLAVTNQALSAPAQGQDQGGPSSSSSSIENIGTQIPVRADVLVTDLIDYGVLGMGLLPAVDYAARHLLTPGAVVVPQKIQVSCLKVMLE